MTKYGLVLLGIIFSAIAQIMIKKSSAFEIRDFSFILFFGLAGVFYVLAFGLYAYILKHFALSKISPVMTIGTMILVVCSGIIFFREVVSVKQSIGILVGILSIYLIIG